MRNQKGNNVIKAIFALILLVYWAAVLWLNFSRNPTYFDTDMYADMLYAREVFRTGTIFPENWIFGNQFYVVATPVLAALFCGITNDPYLPMAFAATIMGIGVLWSFDWMIRYFLPETTERLCATVVFMTIHLVCGDAYYHLMGWQLLFTLCSYYGCYAISLFLCFGCYIRRNSGWSRTEGAVLILSCFLAFANGMQSLRQTAIMVCPLIAVEGLTFLWRLWRKEQPFRKSTLVAVVHSVANFLGLVVIRLLDPKQVAVYGALNRVSFESMIQGFRHAVGALSTVMVTTNPYLSRTIATVFVVLLFFAVWDGIKKKSDASVCCVLLFFISAGAVFAVDLCTTMIVRDVYYFMLYPMTAVLAAIWFRKQKGFGRFALTAVLVVAMIYGCATGLNVPQRKWHDPEKYREVVDYLNEEGIDTIYTGWNHAQEIGLMSNFEIRVGFWNNRFEYVPFLCFADVFDAEASECAYVFMSRDYADKVEEDARNAGADFRLVKSFDSCEAYVYTSEHTVRELYDLVIGD